MKMGRETDSSHWSNPYPVQFPFVTVDGRHFFFGHNTDSRYWFIQELLPGGKMGSETDNGHWGHAYEMMFPFTIKGRTFCLGHSQETRRWFIQELLPGGKMGQETDNGFWETAFSCLVPYWMNSRLFFLRQDPNSSLKTWYIRELLPDGKMGDPTGYGDGYEVFDVAFTFAVAARTYLFAHHMDFKRTRITELLPGGEMGDEVAREDWQNPYDGMFPYDIGGEDYYYGQNMNNNDWFIQELLPGGQMGKQTDSGHWKFTYQVQFPFEILGRQFFYGCSLNTTASPFHPYHWFIQELLGPPGSADEDKSGMPEWAKVSVWSYRGLPEGVGHAALTLSDGTYISWWPTRSDGGKYNSETMQHLSDAFSSPATKNSLVDDFLAEGYSADVEIYIPGGQGGLNIPAIVNWWDTFKNDSTKRYAVLTQNCATTVKDALAAGGAWKFLTGRAGDDFGKIITWTPWEVRDLAARVRDRIKASQ